jgi:hypothetical protein
MLKVMREKDKKKYVGNLKRPLCSAKGPDLSFTV